MNKTALITGASDDIGIELALIHAAKGDNLVLIASCREKLDTFKLELEKRYGVIVYNIEKDLSKKNAPYEIYKELKSKEISIDYLINNTNLSGYGSFANSEWDKQEQMIQLNISSVAHMTRLFLPEMLKNNYGRILNIASTAMIQPELGMSVYTATKAFLLNFTEAITHELKRTGVTVTALCTESTNNGLLNAVTLDKTNLFNANNKTIAKSVAKFGHKHMMNKKGMAIHSFLNKVLFTAIRYVPRKLATYFAKEKFHSAQTDYSIA